MYTMHTLMWASMCAGEDGVGLVWDVETGACKGALQGHRTAVRWAAMLDDGQHALTASGDRMVKAWHLESGTCTKTLPSESSSSSSLDACRCP